ncbi:MAG TPA: MBL fold metallo-hydrolase, partial [Candidatus Saccharimonadales bacterium]|nr:MBL fold metallo-hydrolase [Candidatus Saccharimonadales bacterium]
LGSLTESSTPTPNYNSRMKITKYPQSCLLLEKAGRSIVIDPGNFFSAKHSVEELGPIEAVLYTHQHGDHFDPALMERFKSLGIALYGNAAVAALIGEGATVARSDQRLAVAGFEIMPHDLPHFQKAGIVMPPNTGYIVDGHFFHPGDGIKTAGVRVDDLAAPVGGPFEYQDIKEFAVSLGAKRVIPIHYTNVALYPADPNEFARVMGEVAKVVLLEDGQAVEL